MLASTSLLLLLISASSGLPQDAPKSQMDTVPAPEIGQARPPGLSVEDVSDAYPPPVEPQNWMGATLFGFNGCDDPDRVWKAKIQEAYKDANKLVSIDGVRKNIDWNSAAALEFLGPPELNKKQQSKIQAIFANVATVKTPWTFTHWIRVRCDDPLKECPKKPECPTIQSVATIAYARNPNEHGNDGYPDVNFCKPFFDQRSLNEAMAYGSGKKKPLLRSQLPSYLSRANTMLHELLHLDLASDSVGNQPNPRPRDVKIDFVVGSGDPNQRGRLIVNARAYGPHRTKLLARFMPREGELLPGYFTLRNADSLTMFALARYVQGQTGMYPYGPLVFDKIDHEPIVPPYPTPDHDSPIAFSVNATGATILDMDAADTCTLQSLDTEEKVFTLGKPIDKSLYPSEYIQQHDGWRKEMRSDDEPPAKKMCDFAITQSWTCEPMESNLYATIASKLEGGSTVLNLATPINDGTPWHYTQKGWDKELTVVGEHVNDYIQFNYGDQAWRSTTTEGPATCQLVGDNWKAPQCPGPESIRTYKCSFPC